MKSNDVGSSAERDAVSSTEAYRRPQGRRTRPMRVLREKGIYLVPNLFTSGNLFCGVFAILAVFNADYLSASIAILIASVFDVLDGKIARLTRATSRFGAEYDSLCDVISFGMAPAMLAYAWALGSLGRLGWVAVFLYVVCGALRLARYNLSSGAHSSHFVGLPIPAAASFIASLVLFDSHILQFGKEVRPMLIVGVIYVLAFLMVSTFRYRSLASLPMQGRKPLSLLVGVLLFFLLLIVAPPVMLLASFSFYIISGVLERPIVALYRQITGRPKPAQERLIEAEPPTQPIV
jgi:CDP-diacylglycerol--serine O-phosphatidyltransferase